MISMIVAVGKNGVIGKDNKLPWKLPADLAYFKKVTWGSTVIMGRKTFESIGKPLPGRDNVILTRDPDYRQEGCRVVHSASGAVQLAEGKEAFIIGGAAVYTEFIPYAEKLYITYIDQEFDGDAFFPRIPEDTWVLVAEEKGIRDEKNSYDYFFRIYEKRKK